MKEAFTEDGDAILSSFQSDFQLDWFDHDRQEVRWVSAPIAIGALLDGFSYHGSFEGAVLDVASQLAIADANVAILLYDHEVIEPVLEARGIRFVGTFPYVR